MAILRNIFLRNNTLAPLEFLGIEIPAGGIEDFSYESDIDIQTDPTLVAAIQAGNISIGDGVTFAATAAAGMTNLLSPPLPASLTALGIKTPNETDIVSLTEELVLDKVNDYTIFFDTSVGENRKVPLGALDTGFDINGKVTENVLDTVNDQIGFYDASASINRKTAIDNIRGFTFAQITGFDGSLSESMLFVSDATRLNKNLTVETNTFAFGRTSVSSNAYLYHGGAKDGTTGPIMPYNGVLCRGSLYCEDAKGQSRNFSIYVNGVENPNIFTISGTGAQSDSDTALDIDFVAGDRIQVRGRGPGGKINDTNVLLWVKWKN